MLKTIIIEDEPDSLELLQHLLEHYCTGVQVIGTATDVSSGIQLIQQGDPDLIFLDIYMPGGHGFDILDATPNFKYKVIFVTGFEKFAIKAIRYAALDYLLKPIILDELQAALRRVHHHLSPSATNLKALRQNLQNSAQSLRQIVLSDHRKHKVIPLDQILYIEAKRSYAIFHLKKGINCIGSNPLSFYENLLPSHQFFRIHKSYLVNGHQVEHLATGRGGEVHLQEQIILPVAIRRKAAFLQFLEHIQKSQ